MAKFAWGDSVLVAEDAAVIARPGSPAEIVGISEKQERHGSYLQNFPDGVVYSVEFEDGGDAEVHEDHIVPLASKGDLK